LALPKISRPPEGLIRARAAYPVEGYDSQNNATATVTLIARGASWRTRLLRVDVSVNDTTLNLLVTIKSGSTVILTGYTAGGKFCLDYDLDFGRPADALNEAMSVEVAASGTSGKIVKLYAQGFYDYEKGS
jgi:hypothetical protein